MKASLVKKLERFREQIAEMREVLDDLSSEYRDKFDNASETWQISEKGDECQKLMENCEQAASDLESAESSIMECLS